LIARGPQGPAIEGPERLGSPLSSAGGAAREAMRPGG